MGTLTAGVSAVGLGFTVQGCWVQATRAANSRSRTCLWGEGEVVIDIHSHSKQQTPEFCTTNYVKPLNEQVFLKR